MVGLRVLPLAIALACMAQPADAPKIVFDAVGQSTIQQRLQAVPRKLADRVATLESFFHEAGCDGDRFAEQRVPSSNAPNLVCTLPGETDSEIVVGGHLDSIEAGMGAVDDWSGAVLLPSLYQGLKRVPRRHRFVFVGFAAEEQGLVGSFEFVTKLKRDEIHRIHAMINLECLGLGPPEVWVSRANKRLLDAYSVVASILHVEPRGMNVDGVGDDDSHSFLKFGIPVLTIHSLTRETWHILHHPSDKVDAIHPDDYYTAYRMVAAYLAYLDAVLE
jgi:aminopeptidase-like protein